MALCLPGCPAQLSFPSPGTLSVPLAAVSIWGLEPPPCRASSAHGSAWECPHRGWTHSLNQQTTDAEAAQGGWVQGGMAQDGRPPIPLQGKEAALPGSGSRAGGQGEPGKCCPFGGSVALPWLRKLGKPVPLRKLCPSTSWCSQRSSVTKPAWFPRGYLC